MQASVAASSGAILSAAALGLIVNTLTVLAVAWKGGRFLGHIETTMGSLATEVTALRRSRDEHAHLSQEQARLLERITVQVEHLEERMQRVEDGR